MNAIQTFADYANRGMQTLCNFKTLISTNKTLSKLTDAQKKTILIVGIVLSALTALFLVYRYRLGSKQNIYQPNIVSVPPLSSEFNSSNNQASPRSVLNNNNAVGLDEIKFEITQKEQAVETHQTSEKIDNHVQIQQPLMPSILQANPEEEIEPEREPGQAPEKTDNYSQIQKIELPAILQAGPEELELKVEVKVKPDQALKAINNHVQVQQPEMPAILQIDLEEIEVEVEPDQALAEIENKENDTEIEEVNDIKVEELQSKITEIELFLDNFEQNLYLYLENQLKNEDINLNRTQNYFNQLKAFAIASNQKLVFINKLLSASNKLFTETNYLSETEKVDAVACHHIHTHFNTHFQTIQKANPHFEQKLKIKLANLPLNNDVERSVFSHTYLSEIEQLQILIDHFQKREMETVQSLIQKNFKTNGYYYEKDIKKLAKFVSENHSYLLDSNRAVLRNALKDLLKAQALEDWSDEQKVYDTLREFFKPSNYPSYINYTNYRINYLRDDYYKILQRASKARQFFMDQVGLEPAKIQIPFWYHATNTVEAIIQTGKLEVRERCFKGAWVSTQREYGYGGYTFSFNHRITQLDPQAFIGCIQKEYRWRGLQQAIPIIETDALGKNEVPYVTYIGVPKSAQKENKITILNFLREQEITTLKVFHNHQIDFMQQEIQQAIGLPNLNKHWWNK